MKVFKLSMRFFVCQVIMIIVALTAVMPLYGIASGKPYLFSLITGLIYFITMYSASWRAGRADSRKIPGFYPDRKLPLWISLTTLIVPVILYIIRFAFPDIWKLGLPFLDGSYDFFVSGCKVYGTPDMLYRLWYFPIVAFIPDSSPVGYLLAMFVLPVIIVLGYNVGLKRFSIAEFLYAKVVFKNDDKNPKKESLLKK